MCDVHDDMLFQILREGKTLPVFFDKLFGFLHRRTDFYHVASENDETAAIGLPKQLAEKLLQHAFFKWQKIHQNDEPKLIPAEDIPTAYEEEIETIIDESDELSDLAQLSICKKQHEESFSSADSYNGASLENYSWSQTISEVDIIVKVPENTTSKDLDVLIQANRICVKLKRVDLVLLEGTLCKKCKHHDAIWSLDHRKLEIHLEKASEVWWDCLIDTEEKLDLSTIDCTRPFEELPQEAQAKIEELQWNQERKRMGLPTSAEMNLASTLEKAWNVEGSPFSGPFDPTSVQLL